jgi:leader peptidase (prepilin peptidase) / N-methyltransferase
MTERRIYAAGRMRLFRIRSRAVTPDPFPAPDLRPNFAILACGSGAAAVLSFIFLPWPLAIAATMLGILMVAGADVDARTLLLPDAVTFGAVICGILAAPVLDPGDPWTNIGIAVLRAAGTALLLALLRMAYSRLRGHEGLGFGDVKLAAAIGAWLPLDAIPICFSLATTVAMLWLLFCRRNEDLKNLRLPFGAFLCPALWLVFFITSLGNG